MQTKQRPKRKTRAKNTMFHKTLHRKPNIEQQEFQWKNNGEPRFSGRVSSSSSISDLRRFTLVNNPMIRHKDEKTTWLWLWQTEHIRGHLRHKYSVTGTQGDRGHLRHKYSVTGTQGDRGHLRHKYSVTVTQGDRGTYPWSSKTQIFSNGYPRWPWSSKTQIFSNGYPRWPWNISWSSKTQIFSNGYPRWPWNISVVI